MFKTILVFKHKSSHVFLDRASYYGNIHILRNVYIYVCILNDIQYPISENVQLRSY